MDERGQMSGPVDSEGVRTLGTQVHVPALSPHDAVWFWSLLLPNLFPRHTTEALASTMVPKALLAPRVQICACHLPLRNPLASLQHRFAQKKAPLTGLCWETQ